MSEPNKEQIIRCNNIAVGLFKYIHSYILYFFNNSQINCLYKLFHIDVMEFDFILSDLFIMYVCMYNKFIYFMYVYVHIQIYIVPTQIGIIAIIIARYWDLQNIGYTKIYVLHTCLIT